MALLCPAKPTTLVTTVTTVEEVPELATARLTQLAKSHATSYTTPRDATVPRSA